MTPTTQGERLFLLIRDKVLDSLGDGQISWAGVDRLMEFSGGANGYAAYVKGATAILTVRKLLTFWRTEKASIGAENLEVNSIRRYVKSEVFPTLQDSLAKEVARKVKSAQEVSFVKIAPNLRRRMRKSTGAHFCYLCNAVLDLSAEDGDPAQFTLEHLWPSSLGGDSVEENLLPACIDCQNKKADSMSWEWPNLHNVVLSPKPSVSALASVGREIKIARHYFEAMQLCDTKKMTLKEAFLNLGPMNDLAHVSNDEPVTFFNLKTTA